MGKQQGIRIKHAGQSAGVDMNLVHQRFIADAAYTAKKIIEQAGWDLTRYVNEENLATQTADILSLLKHLVDLFILIETGKSDRVETVCIAISGAISKVAKEIGKTSAELDALYNAQEQLEQLNSPDMSEFLKPHLTKALSDLKNDQEVITIIREEEEKTQDQILQLEDEVEEMERKIIEAQGEIEASPYSNSAINIEAIAKRVREEFSELSVTEQFQKMQEEMEKFALLGGRIKNLKNDLIQLEITKAEIEQQLKSLKAELASHTSERLEYELSTLLPAQAMVDHLQALIDPPKPLQFAPPQITTDEEMPAAAVSAASQTAEADVYEAGPLDAESPSEDKLLAVLHLITSGGEFSAQQRSINTISHIGGRAGVWKNQKNIRAKLYSLAQSLQNRGVVDCVKNYGLNTHFSLTDTGKQQAILCLNEQAWDPNLIRAIVAMMAEAEKNRKERNSQLEELENDPLAAIPATGQIATIILERITSPNMKPRSRSMKIVYEIGMAAGYLSRATTFDQFKEAIGAMVIFRIVGKTNLAFHSPRKANELIPIFKKALGIDGAADKKIQHAIRQFPNLK